MITVMPKHEPSSQYPNVNEIAAAQGLIWDGHETSSAYEISDIEPLIDARLWDERAAESYKGLFDHVIRFRPKGSGRRDPVLAISAPYLHDTDELAEFVLSFCAVFGLAARVGDERYRVYSETRTLPIVFWRPDRHLLR